MMKHKTYIGMLGGLLLSLIACSSSNDAGGVLPEKAVLSCSPQALEIPAEGGTSTVNVTCSTGEWTAYAAEGCTSWVQTRVSGNLNHQGSIEVTVKENLDVKPRQGVVVVKSGTSRMEVPVSQAETVPSSDIPTPEGYRLVWHDEFNEGSVLSREWKHEVKPAGWVNNELQTYVDGEADGKRVTELVDGNLNIHCFKASDGKIYSGRVYAHVNEGWLYGYFEARMMLPKGKGTWPAFWMMPVNNDFSTNPWPGCGEIDIMEEVGADPNEVSSSIHCAAYNHTIGTQKTAKRNIETAESAFHVYACEWTPDYLRFFVDGAELMTFRNDGGGKRVWPFTYAFYPILNLAWGGAWGGYKGVDESALPVTMKVDYVRVFQKIK